MEDFPVRLPIKLGQFVKLASLAETGGHARELIEEGFVSVNGEVDTRRGRKLEADDLVTLNVPEGPRYSIRVTEDA